MKNLYISEKVLEEFYGSLSKESASSFVHIPRSDVFYVREHLRAVFGKNFTLDYVEWALLKEGLIEAKDCYNPQLKKSWEEYPLEKESK
jgi:hypothetical protein